MRTLAVRRKPAREQVWPPEYVRQVGQAAEVAVIALRLIRKHRVQRMMKVVVPLRMKSESMSPARPDHARVAQIAFGNEHQVPAELGFELLDLFGKLLEERERRGVEDRMDCIEAQAIDVVIAEPHLRVV